MVPGCRWLGVSGDVTSLLGSMMTSVGGRSFRKTRSQFNDLQPQCQGSLSFSPWFSVTCIPM